MLTVQYKKWSGLSYGADIRGIGSRVKEQSGDNRATQFLIQKVAIGVQRGNAASVMATLPSSQDWTEFASLPTV